jgi:hypothetical protein
MPEWNAMSKEQRIYSLAAVLDRLILMVADRPDKAMTAKEWEEMSEILAAINAWAAKYEPDKN